MCHTARCQFKFTSATWHLRTWIKISTSTVVAVATCGTSQSSIIELSKLIISMHGAALNTLASSDWKIDTHPIHRPYTNPGPIRVSDESAGGRDRDRDPKFPAANGARPKNGRSFWCSCQCHPRQLLSNQQGWTKMNQIKT